MRTNPSSDFLFYGRAQEWRFLHPILPLVVTLSTKSLVDSDKAEIFGITREAKIVFRRLEDKSPLRFWCPPRIVYHKIPWRSPCQRHVVPSFAGAARPPLGWVPNALSLNPVAGLPSYTGALGRVHVGFEL